MKTHFCPVEKDVISFEGQYNWCDCTEESEEPQTETKEEESNGR